MIYRPTPEDVDNVLAASNVLEKEYSGGNNEEEIELAVEVIVTELESWSTNQ